MEGASSKGSFGHKQGWGEVHHFVKHCIKDITTYARHEKIPNFFGIGVVNVMDHFNC